MGLWFKRGFLILQFAIKAFQGMSATAE